VRTGEKQTPLWAWGAGSQRCGAACVGDPGRVTHTYKAGDAGEGVTTVRRRAALYGRRQLENKFPLGEGLITDVGDAATPWGGRPPSTLL
jgi:hypothetical protein